MPLNREEMILGIDKTLCKRDFYFFCEWIFENIYKIPFDDNWHFKVLCQFMQEVFERKISRLVINIPPKYGKTEFIVILFTMWSYINNPYCNFIHVSYSASLALRNSNKIRQTLMSTMLRSMFGIAPNVSEQSKSRWSLQGGGQFYAVSSLGAITGEGAGLKRAKGFAGALIVDDPHKAGTENSEVQRERVLDNFETAIATRLNEDRTPVIVIMQRLHEMDLAGFLLKGKSKLGKFKHLNLPAACEGKTDYDKRRIGQPLWPEFHSKKILERMETADPYNFSGQFQQRPTKKGGSIIQKEWLRYYGVLPQLEIKIISCDLNFHDRGRSYACFSIYGRYFGKIYLVDRSRGRWNFVDSCKFLSRLIHQHRDYHALIVENKANGPALIDAMKRNGVSRIISWPPQGQQMKSKIERLYSVTAVYQAGDMLYPKAASFLDSHVGEILAFPNGTNDDAVDCESQAIQYLEKSSGGFFASYKPERSKWQELRD